MVNGRKAKEDVTWAVARGQTSPEDFTDIYQMPGSTTTASQNVTHLMALPLSNLQPPDWGWWTQAEGTDKDRGSFRHLIHTQSIQR